MTIDEPVKKATIAWSGIQLPQESIHLQHYDTISLKSQFCRAINTLDTIDSKIAFFRQANNYFSIKDAYEYLGNPLPNYDEILEKHTETTTQNQVERGIGIITVPIAALSFYFIGGYIADAMQLSPTAHSIFQKAASVISALASTAWAARIHYKCCDRTEKEKDELAELFSKRVDDYIIKLKEEMEKKES